MRYKTVSMPPREIGRALDIAGKLLLSSPRTARMIAGDALSNIKEKHPSEPLERLWKLVTTGLSTDTMIEQINLSLTIEKIENLEALHKEGMTPLMCAVKNDRYYAVKALVEANADVYACNHTNKRYYREILD